MKFLGTAGQFVAEAGEVLLANRTRSALTIVGLVVGVAAVIAIEIAGAGMAGAVTGILGSLSDQSFFVFPDARQADPGRASVPLSALPRLVQRFPQIVAAIPAEDVERLVSAGNARARLQIGADTNVAYATVPLVYGRQISAADVASGAHVAVLTHDAYAHLFPPGDDPVGASIRIGDARYVVIGVQGRPTSGILPPAFLYDVAVPYTVFERELLASRTVDAIRVVVADPRTIAATEIALTRYLRAQSGGRARYQTFDRRSFSNAVDGIFAALTLVVALIGAVSLLVAGIGIMNIMLVSVTERTREIGIRKAIGATSGSVLVQFFLEALVLSLAGCGLGLALGLGVGYLVDRYALIAISGIEPRVPWFEAVAVAVGFATLVTLLFGTYPAYRASRLDPIEALRYE